MNSRQVLIETNNKQRIFQIFVHYYHYSFVDHITKRSQHAMMLIGFITHNQAVHILPGPNRDIRPKKKKKLRQKLLDSLIYFYSITSTCQNPLSQLTKIPYYFLFLLKKSLHFLLLNTQLIKPFTELISSPEVPKRAVAYQQ